MRAKSQRKADTVGRPESAKKHRTPAAYINLPIKSMQKKQNRKTIYRHIKQPNQKRNSFAFGFSSRKPTTLTTFLKEF